MFLQNPDFEWLMIDASYVKVPPHVTGARGGKDMGYKKEEGSNTKIHLVVEMYSPFLRVVSLVVLPTIVKNERIIHFKIIVVEWLVSIFPLQKEI